MDPTAIGQPRVNEGHCIVKTCNLTYFNAGTSGVSGTPGQAGWEED